MERKNDKPFIPPMPYIEQPSKETIEKLQKMSKKDVKQFEKSETYKKYVQPVIDRERAAKKLQRSTWWKNNWINVTTLIVAVITLIVTIVFGLR